MPDALSSFRYSRPEKSRKWLRERSHQRNAKVARKRGADHADAGPDGIGSADAIYGGCSAKGRV